MCFILLVRDDMLHKIDMNPIYICVCINISEHTSMYSILVYIWYDLLSQRILWYIIKGNIFHFLLLLYFHPFYSFYPTNDLGILYVPSFSLLPLILAIFIKLLWSKVIKSIFYIGIHRKWKNIDLYLYSPSFSCLSIFSKFSVINKCYLLYLIY